MLLVALIWAINRAGGWLVAMLEMTAERQTLMTGLLVALVLAYALLIALPFVPGVELGLMLLAMRGAEIAPFIYLATVAGLMLAFGAGYCLPYAWLERGLRRVRLQRSAEFVAKAGGLAPEDRLAMLRSLAPERVGRLALRWRYLLMAVLYNAPGSGLIGGGGGISFVAGLSRMFAPLPTFATVALAVAPVPLFVWWYGMPAVGG